MKEKKEEEARVSNTLHEGSRRELNVIKMRKIAEKRKGKLYISLLSFI